jgi:bis(5'-nucleosyl)-tetraphosphatase (symmetrical)
MAIYAIGDVQGCDYELGRMLDRLNLDPAQDEVWFVGDLVNRGPRSLEVLRRVVQLGRAAIVTLGNHDLHLLALGLAGHVPVDDEQLGAVLEAPDADELLNWLRRRPLAHYRPDLNTLMVHAGVASSWDPLQTIKLAREVEHVLQSDRCGLFLQAMYGDRPDTWSPGLAGDDRLRFIINCLTRIRFCDPHGSLVFHAKGPPGKQGDDLIPWFELPDRATDSVRIVFGHWSTLGLLQRRNLLALDTGCVWGGRLTAVRLDGPAKIYSVSSHGYRTPGRGG